MLSLQFKGSKIGFAFGRMKKPPSVMVKLPHAIPDIGPGLYKPGNGIASIRVIKKARGSLIHIVHDAGFKSFVTIDDMGLHLSLRR